MTATGALPDGWAEIGPRYDGGKPHGMQFVRPSGMPGEFEYWFRPCSPADNCRECMPEVTVTARMQLE